MENTHNLFIGILSHQQVIFTPTNGIMKFSGPKDPEKWEFY